MLLSQSQCQILSVGEVKTQNNFKKCYVRVRTKELRDESTNEVIRQSGTFDAEVALSNDRYYTELTVLAVEAKQNSDAFVPCTFMLRSFTYKEKDQDKLGKQLQLKRWWK